jgi:inward rectifier potassium channel
MGSKWPYLILFIFSIFTFLNLLFASLYFVGGDCLANVRKGSFNDAFFFSLQTLTTIGYGNFYPKNLYAQGIVYLEAFTGLMVGAMITGIMFAKFSIPQARIMFSKNALITIHDGQPVLIFRAANERSNNIVEAQVKVVLLHQETMKDGSKWRKMSSLRLVRDSTPVFALTWSVIHPIEQDSPLFQLEEKDFIDKKAEILITIVGLDNTSGQTIHKRHSYHYSEIVWDVKFSDIISFTAEGERVIDYNKFHLIEKLSIEKPSIERFNQN